MIERYSDSKKRGCPTCNGVAPKSCMRCRGRSRLCDWWETSMGVAHESALTPEERREADLLDRVQQKQKGEA